jgi:hypothetical protein
MMNEQQFKNKVLQVFYTPMKANGEHEIMHVVHDLEKGAIYRVYTDNFIVKNSSVSIELENMKKLGEFTTTTFEFSEVLEQAKNQNILNIAL